MRCRYLLDFDSCNLQLGLVWHFHNAHSWGFYQATGNFPFEGRDCADQGALCLMHSIIQGPRWLNHSLLWMVEVLSCQEMLRKKQLPQHWVCGWNLYGYIRTSVHIHHFPSCFHFVLAIAGKKRWKKSRAKPLVQHKMLDASHLVCIMTAHESGLEWCMEIKSRQFFVVRAETDFLPLSIFTVMLYWLDERPIINIFTRLRQPLCHPLQTFAVRLGHSQHLGPLSRVQCISNVSDRLQPHCGKIWRPPESKHKHCKLSLSLPSLLCEIHWQWWLECHWPWIWAVAFRNSWICHCLCLISYLATKNNNFMVHILLQDTDFVFWLEPNRFFFTALVCKILFPIQSTPNPIESCLVFFDVRFCSATCLLLRYLSMKKNKTQSTHFLAEGRWEQSQAAPARDWWKSRQASRLLKAISAQCLKTNQWRKRRPRRPKRPQSPWIARTTPRQTSQCPIPTSQPRGTAPKRAHASVLIGWKVKQWHWSMERWSSTQQILGVVATLGMMGSTPSVQNQGRANGVGSPGVM